MNPSLLSAQTVHTHLRRLLLLRNWSIVAQFATLALVHRFISPDFAWVPMIAAVCFLVLLNGFTWWRLSLDYPVGHTELFLQLCGDVLALTVLLYFAGGSTNPFVSLYLLPLVIAAATLPRAHTWGMAGLTLACYSLLMVWYVPLPGGHAQHEAAAMTQMEHGHHQHADILAAASDAEPSPFLPPGRGKVRMGVESGSERVSTPTPTLPLQGGGDEAANGFAGFNTDAFNTHVLGMWLGFVISAVVIAFFVVEMARAVRSRDAQLNRIREETLRNERIVALGTQAASAAHELGTPLSTMAVVIGEMRDDGVSPEQRDSLGILDEQVKNCKRILDGLLSHAQETASDLSAEAFLRNVLDEWQLLRPAAKYRFETSGAQPAPALRADPALRSALLNLLNNAADASPEGMDILLRWDDDSITLEIRDHGPGLTPDAAARAGSAFFTTKQGGRGLGLFLANATIERLGGTVRLFNREGGGATTEVTLPRSTAA